MNKLFTMPLRAGTDRDITQIFDDADNEVAHVYYQLQENLGEKRRDHFILCVNAFPDLLEACKKMADHLGEMGHPEALLDEARDAIAKAESDDGR